MKRFRVLDNGVCTSVFVERSNWQLFYTPFTKTYKTILVGVFLSRSNKSKASDRNIDTVYDLQDSGH